MKKYMLTALSVLMVIAIIAGCSSNNTNSGSTSSNSSSSSQSSGSAEKSDGSDGSLNFSKHLDIEIMGQFVTDVAENDALLQLINDKFNVTIKPTITKDSNYVQTLNVRFASGDVPDWFRINDETQFGQLAADGALVNLSEYVDKYNFTNIQKQFDLPMANMLTTNGSYYRIPNSLGHLKPGLVARADWMEELGLETPKTWDDYRKVLKTIVDNDPDGKGANGFTSWTYELFDAFSPAWTGYFGWGNVAGELTWYHTDPRYKEFLKYFAGLYKDKLIDPEIFTNSWDQAFEKFDTGRSGVLGMNLIQIWWDYQKNGLAQYDPSARMTAFIPVPEGPMGAYLGSGRTYWSMSSFSNNVDEDKKLRMLAIADYLLSDEGVDLTLYGIEGKHHTVVDGKKVQNKDVVNQEWGQGLYWLGEFLNFAASDLLSEEQHVIDYMAWQDQPNSLKHDMAAYFTSEERTKLNAEISEVDNNWITQFIIGDKDIDSNWDAYVSALNKAGLEREKELVTGYIKDNNVEMPEIQAP